MNRFDSEKAPASAEAWIARLGSPTASNADRAALDAWRARDPANDRAFLEAAQLHDVVGGLRDNDMVRAASRQALLRTARPQRVRRWAGTGIAAAAVLVLLIGVPLTWQRYARGVLVSPTETFTTVVEQRWITLSDGTRMLLDADSVASVRMDAQRRVITIERGRAEFRVARASTPFEVRVGGVVVHDLGTAFQVNYRDDDTQVSLLEGQISLSEGQGAVTQTLQPGQRIRVAANGEVGAPQPMELTEARSWTTGQLVFRAQRLDDLLTQMNRYAARKVSLGEESLGDIRISGSFRAGDQDALVKALAAGWNLRAEPRADGSLALYGRRHATP